MKASFWPLIGIIGATQAIAEEAQDPAPTEQVVEDQETKEVTPASKATACAKVNEPEHIMTVDEVEAGCEFDREEIKKNMAKAKKTQKK